MPELLAPALFFRSGRFIETAQSLEACSKTQNGFSLSSFETGGRTDVLLLTKKLNLDLGILIAVDRVTTGATAHNLRGLANAYVLACESGQASRAEEYRSHLLRELVRGARTSKP